MRASNIRGWLMLYLFAGVTAAAWGLAAPFVEALLSPNP
jgi:hypothetical protein